MDLITAVMFRTPLICSSSSIAGGLSYSQGPRKRGSNADEQEADVEALVICEARADWRGSSSRTKGWRARTAVGLTRSGKRPAICLLAWHKSGRNNQKIG